MTDSITSTTTVIVTPDREVVSTRYALEDTAVSDGEGDVMWPSHQPQGFYIGIIGIALNLLGELSGDVDTTLHIG